MCALVIAAASSLVTKEGQRTLFKAAARTPWEELDRHICPLGGCVTGTFVPWCRLQGSLESLRDKQQRTVYRLTLVKGWNMAEVEAYAHLVAMGCPDFIEIKGVTYCGRCGTLVPSSPAFTLLPRLAPAPQLAQLL